jgi:hypothetical protein
MRVACYVLLAIPLSVVAGCDNDPTSADSNTFDGGAFDAAAGEGGLPPPKYTVDCLHPGAGRKLADGKCECVLSSTVFTGLWNGLYTCRENGTCVDRDVPEQFLFAQAGNVIHADDAIGGAPADFVFDGIVCGEYFQWSGGPTSGKYKECGVLRFVDAKHYVKDSCYQYASDAGATNCEISFAGGCPGQSGMCTNSGARDPEPAPAITKNICP